MKARLMSCLVVVVGFSMVANANLVLQWGSGNHQIMNYNGANIPYSESDGTQGAFAQLINTGPDGTPDFFATNQLSTTGVTDDDFVVSVTYSYGGPALGTQSNEFKLVDSTVDTEAENGTYYVRVFNVANTAYVTKGTNALLSDLDYADIDDVYYWESATHTFTYSELGVPDEFYFTGGSDRQTTFAVVPEPATALIFGPGSMLLIALRRLMLRRRRRSNASELEDYVAQMEPAYATGPVERTLSRDCPRCGSKEHCAAPPTWWMSVMPYVSRHHCNRCEKEYVSLDW
ncbi:hypothetical protein [Kiritimatiella glycovorans]|uniref:PEP-CTERM protein-sorting domain-containing protein n=1 Tax=Kiritimatiella glycovorans TaxID=1307763 RepID=A0A0G3EHY7_9BACT|nr:hypothetical protein [Kiritimatiella glycovorans]AKJ64420.1 hypothetical protein L21SP4_01171 [Kiritimatiella glycovorans]